MKNFLLLLFLLFSEPSFSANTWIDLPARSWRQPVATAALLPVAGNTSGDAIITVDNLNLYVWNGSAWILEVSPGATPPGGSSGQYQFNNAGAFAGSSALTVSGGNVSSTGTITATNLSGTNTGDVTIGTANGLSLSLQALSLQAATNSVPGALTAADHTTFAAKVSSVGLVAPVGYMVSGSPVTSSGNITLSLAATQAVSASTIDWSTGNLFTKSIGSTNTTFLFTNQASGQTIVTRIIATTGLVTWPTVKWPGGTVPVQTVSGTDVCTFIYDGSLTYGSCIQDLK